MVQVGWTDAQGRGTDPTLKKPEQGAATDLWTATAVCATTSPLIEGAGPVYCVDADVAIPEQVKPWATDPAEAGRLLAHSAQLTGVDA